ncbi:MAG: B12-binding domain-containing radical SAM protein, partial [Chloroflexi bacterium]|nr:B12-binding domain-containing radical SAM protein [Chloroflexota bacterium]
NTILYRRRYYPKSAARILDEITHLQSRYGVEYIVFRDEDFFSQKQRVRDLVQGIGERGLRFGWYANTRASYFRPTYLWDDLLGQLHAAGCDRFAIGVESGSQRVLDEIIHKDITLEQVEQAARLCHAHGINVGYSFIIGVPGETQPEMIATLRFMKRLKELQPRCYFFGPQIFRPYPGTELYDKALQFGFTQPEDLEGWVGAVSQQTGFMDTKSLLWIDNVRFVQQVSVLRSFFFRRWSEVWRGRVDLRLPLRAAATALAKFRLRRNVWAAPVELLGYQAYYGLLHPLRLRWAGLRRRAARWLGRSGR